MSGRLVIAFSAFGFAIAILLIAIRGYITLDPKAFAYLMSITRITSFFILLFLALFLTFASNQIVSKRFYTMGLFFFSALVPNVFHILSFPFFPDFITENTRDKAAWLYVTTTIFILLALTSAVLYHRLTFLHRSLLLLALTLFILSCIISTLIVFYYPYLPKLYQPGYGSTPVRDFFDIIFINWISYLAYHTFKHKPFGPRANGVILLAYVYMAISALLTIFYVAFTDPLIVASTVYRSISHLLLIYGVLMVEVKDTGENILRSAEMIIDSLTSARPEIGDDVNTFSLGEALEKGGMNSVCIYDLKDGKLLAHFYGFEREEEPYQLNNYSDLVERGMGYIGENQHFHVRGDHIIISKGFFSPENPIVDRHVIYAETLIHAYFLQYDYFNRLIQEKSKELSKLYIILETSEHVTQAYDNLGAFFHRVLERLDYVLQTHGSIFYFYDKSADNIDESITSLKFVRNFLEINCEEIVRKAIGLVEEKGITDGMMFVKFEEENYQVGIIALRKTKTFSEEDLIFFEVVSNQVFHLVKLARVLKNLEEYRSNLKLLSERDPLTGLYNRRSFETHIQDYIDRSERTKGVFSLIILDIDNFKAINDTYGYSVGDLVLKSFANIIRKNIRRLDVPSRLGQDQFAVLLPFTEKGAAKFLVDRIVDRIKEGIGADGHTIDLSVSTVVLSYPTDGLTVEELISTGELLMQDVKRYSKGKLYIVGEETKGRISIVREIERAMIKGLSKDAVIPYFQEIINVKNGKLFGFEVLMRIRLKDKILTADKFIPIAEKLKRMHKLDLILARKVLESYRMLDDKNLFLFLNMVPENVNEQFAEVIKSIADSASVPTDRIVFEITERQAIEDMLSVAKFIKELKSLGFKFAVDDFGAGYSSLYYLKYIPVDFMKIEGEFIKHLPYSETDRVFIRGIVTLARELGVKTIAEFVEDEEIFEHVKELGIDYAQGYYFGKPEPLDAKIKKFFSKE